MWWVNHLLTHLDHYEYLLRKIWQISIFNTILFTLFLTFRSYPSSKSSESSETTSLCINLMAGRSELYFNNVGITIIPTTLYCMYYTYVRIVCWSQLDNVPYIIRLCLQHCNPFQQPRFFILQYYIVKVTTRVTTLWTWRARPNSYPCSGGRTRD